MISEEFSFIGGDPGAVKFGNFINYYSFHNIKERINSLHPNMFTKMNYECVVCLDIGCNTGELTQGLFSYLKTNIYPNCDIYMLAIDIDPTLIKRAQEINTNPSIKFTTANIMTEDKLIIDYLASQRKDAFDITFCFSVTMWIHINNGDEGLQEFLNFIKLLSNTLIIEPQPWKCYRNAQRRMKKSGSSFPLYDKLKIKSNVNLVIEDIVTKSHEKVYESCATSWDRKIQSFKRKIK